MGTHVLINTTKTERDRKERRVVMKNTDREK